MTTKVLVIGGGFYGLYLATYFASRGVKVSLAERESLLMSRASYNNQARVHGGYHYPRSILTAFRSRVSYSRFCDEFSHCIDSSHQHYYLIAKQHSNVTAKQFYEFCVRIGAPIVLADDRVSEVVNGNMVEAAFLVDEVTFDAVSLRDAMSARAEEAGVSIFLNNEVLSVSQGEEGLDVDFSCASGRDTETFDAVYNCTYSSINNLSEDGGILKVDTVHEATEMCLVEMPESLRNIGMTVMCGPFFSMIPFPSEGVHSFSHVRYTPHYRWTGRQYQEISNDDVLARIRQSSAWGRMRLDAKRYVPDVRFAKYVKSLWEVKTTLRSCEANDSRPILFRRNCGLNGYHAVLGGKIDNVYDVVAAIEAGG